MIQDKIYEMRGVKVMLDYDLAELYGIETKRLNDQVKRNALRFPPEFMVRLTVKELRGMRSQFATASQLKRSKNGAPFAFTEHGVAMLAGVLHSERAIQMNIAIFKTFIALREFVSNYKGLVEEVNTIKELLPITMNSWRLFITQSKISY